MTRKNAFRLLASVMVAVIAFSVWTYFQQTVTRRNFNKIQVGMTEKQVRELLGTPTWNSNAAPEHPAPYCLSYSGHGCGISIDFNAAGEVAELYFEDSPNDGWSQLDWETTMGALLALSIVVAILVRATAAWRYSPPQNERAGLREDGPETTRQSR
jgi:hypothetical protein